MLKGYQTLAAWPFGPWRGSQRPMQTNPDLTLEQAHQMAKTRWGRNVFASVLDGVYQVGVYIGSNRAVMGEGSSFAEAVKDAKLPRVRRKR